MDLPLDDALEHADAVGDMHHIVAGGEVGQRTDWVGFLLCLAALFKRSAHPAVGEHRQLDLGILKTSRQAARQDIDLLRGQGWEVSGIVGIVALAHQVACQGAPGLFGACQDADGVAAVQVGIQILSEVGQLAAPHRQLHRIDVVQLLERDIPDAPGKGIQEEGGMQRGPLGNAVVVHQIAVAALKQHPLLKEDLHVLGHQAVGAAQLLSDTGRLADKERCIVGEIVQQGTAALIEHRQVLVDVLEGQAVPELAGIAEQMLLGWGGVLARSFLARASRSSAKLSGEP